MSLKNYFEAKKGLGVISTADGKGRVNAALYARPNVSDDKTVSFIMADRLTYANIRKNPYAVYLFKEDGPGYAGQRLYLKKRSESKDIEKIKALSRRSCPEGCSGTEYLKGSTLVTFKVEKVLPLTGGKK